MNSKAGTVKKALKPAWPGSASGADAPYTADVRPSFVKFNSDTEEADLIDHTFKIRRFYP